MEERFQKVLDLFGGKPFEATEDSEGLDFDKPIRGKYKCRIAKLERYSGQSDKCIDEVNADGKYDMWSLSLQVEEDVEGDKSGSRYLSKTYSNVANRFQDDPDEGARKLMQDLFTANVNYDVTKEVDSTCHTIIEQLAPQIIDQLVNVSAYPSKKGKQVVRVVNEFKLKKQPATATADSDW